MHYRIHTLLVLFLLVFSQANHADINPVANNDAMIIFGNARFTLLTPQLIRMEFSATSTFEDKASLAIVNRQLPTPAFTKKIRGNTLSIRTANLLITYINDGHRFNADNLSIAISSDKKAVATWNPSIKDNKNLKGTLRTLDQTNGWDAENKLEDGIISRSGWSLIDDSNNNLFDGNTEWNWVTPRPADNIDWYFFGHGNDYKQALYDFTQIAGKIPMPPKYALGYWWSRYWIYNDNEMRELVKKFREFHIPLDVLIIDMDWHETYGFSANNLQQDSQGQYKGWTGYTWNKNLFPQPEKFIRWTNEQALKTALNLHPASGIPTMEEKYAEFSSAYGRNNNNEYIPFNLSEKKWATVYFDTMLKPMQTWGVDFWWLDWQQYLNDKNIPNLSVTWWLNYTFYSNMEKTGKRPMIFHRWGGLGNHRYPIGFSGDASTNWDTLDFETYFTATAANVGYGYWSHDIGGHVSTGQPTDGELYLRWLQFGALSPILRTHASKISLIERRPWMFPDYFFAMRAAIQFRYSIAPYLYSAAHQTYMTGISIIHPLYYDYPQKLQAYTYKNEYFFGDHMIAAPVTSPVDKNSKLAEKKIWLPQGEWFEYSSGTLLKGDSELTRHYTVDEIPLFIKAGSIIPMNPVVENLQTKPSRQILALIPGGNGGSTDIYDDDETTNAYQQQQFSTRTITSTPVNKNMLKITIGATHGNYDGMPAQQAFDIKLLNRTLPVDVQIISEPNATAIPVDISYSNTELASIISLPLLPANRSVEITITFAQTFAEQNQLFNGNKGFLQRISHATETLKYASALNDWGGTLPNEVYVAGNIINQLEYEPEQAAPLMRHLNQLKPGLYRTLIDIPSVSQDTKNAVISFLELNHDSSEKNH